MNPIWPGATIGIIGGGQLARMIAFEARRMGYRIAILDPDADGPAAQVADLHIQGDIDDLTAGRALADESDVITIDSEHIPADLLEALESTTAVRPGGSVLRAIQDRLRQRRFLESNGLPQARFAEISRDDDLGPAATTVGFPAVIKTRRQGYDGKGQARVVSLAELGDAWIRMGRTPATLESFVDFEKEISVILARGVDGEIRFHPIAENRHRNHILHTTHVPASICGEVAARAEQIGERIATALGHVGMMAVELFVTREGDLLVNEIAPRTHNSAHYTFGACVTSQFEQQVRAICGLPLGDPSLLRPAVMLNLLGDSWRGDRPGWSALLSHPGVRLHVYGKRKANPGRKMGHVLVMDETVELAEKTVERIAHELDSPD